MPNFRNNTETYKKSKALNTEVDQITTLGEFNDLNSVFSDSDYSKDSIQQLIELYNNMKIGYVKRIETYCWFYNTGEVVGKDDSNSKYDYYRYKLNTGKDAHYYRCEMAKINVDKLSIDAKKISNLYNDILKSAKGYSTEQYDLFINIKTELSCFLGNNVDLSGLKRKKNTYVDYNDLENLKLKIDLLYDEIDKFSKSGLKKNIINKASDVKIRINTDIESVGDTSYGYDVSDVERRELAKEAVDAAWTYNTHWAEFVIPSYSQMISFIQNRFKNIKFDGKKLIYRINNIFDSNGIIETLGKKVENLQDYLKKLKDKVNKIIKAYEKLEKSSENKFEGNKTKKKYSKTEIATKYSKLVEELRNSGYSKKESEKYAKKYLSEILKSTKSKVSVGTVISIYKKWKKNGNISGNLYSNKKKDNDKKDNDKKDNDKKEESITQHVTGAASATGAKVEKIKKKNKNKKTKNKNKKSKNLAVASAATIAAYEKTMKKKSETISNIKIGTTNKIEQAKLNLNTKISQINNDRDAKIANIEAKRDSDIANLYDDASDKINNIDITEADAKEQINTIKENLENDINSINNKANEEIEKVKTSADEQIAQANKDSQAEIEDIQKSSDKEINNITENGVHEKTKTAESFENAAKETPAAEEADTSSLDEANSNKTESATTLENSKKDYNDNISAKEQEIVNQANNVENSTETVATEVEDAGTTEQTIVYEQESDTASNNDSGNSVNYSSYNSSDSNEATSAATNVGSSVDTAASDVESEVVETPAVPDDTSEATLIPDNPNNEETAEISSSNSSSEILDTPKKESKSSNIAIPIGLGVAATGAAAVAGVRFVKNRKQNEDVDETYDDENNDIDDYESGSDDSEYMKDDYLGPAGSMYTDTDLPEDNELSEIPDDTQYTDAGQLEEELEDDDFSEDEVLNDLG